ncbi:MAG: protein kinase [Polyangia bacterium]
MNDFPVRFGPYVLLRSLSEGGMGEVFLAMSGPPGLETLCVIKRILQERRGDAEFLRRFRHEADIARRLVHGNIAQTHAVGEISGEPFIAQEFVDGHDLQELLDRAAGEGRPIPVAAAVQVACQVARGLAYAHDFEGLELVHRDVTPGNIRVTYAGEVKLLDFGIARSELSAGLTVPGQRWGKLAFMSPEQARNRALDRRSDIYALGLVLWTMLTGRAVGTTIQGDRVVAPSTDRQRLLEDLLKHDPPAPSRLSSAVPVALDEVVARALAKRCEDRFANAADLAAALAPFGSVVPSGEAILAELLQSSFDARAERTERAELVSSAQRALRTRATPASVAVPTPAAMASAAAPPVKRRSRRRASAQAAGRNWRVVLAAVLGALVVVGFVAYDFLRLRQAADAPEPTAAVVAPAAPSAIPAPESATPPVALVPAVAVPQAGTPSAPPRDSRPAVPTGGAGTHAPRPVPEASLADPAALLERAQAAFDAGNLDRAQSEARRAAALGNHEADALLGAIAFKRGDLDEAERLLSKTLARDPGNARIARQLQLVRAKQGP